MTDTTESQEPAVAEQFWDEIRRVLASAGQAATADELIAVVATGPDQTSGSEDAFFAGSGGNDQLLDALDTSVWEVFDIKAQYWWKARSRRDDSAIEYIEGDVKKLR